MSCRSGSESGQQAPGFGHRCGGRLAKALRPALAALATVTSLAVAPAPAVAWTQQAFLLSDVVVRSQRGDSPASILNALRVSRTSFALRGSDFARLRAAGVSDAVLDHLQQGFLDDVTLIIRRGMAAYGRCGPCYPQQVDLGSLETNGSVVQTSPDTSLRTDRPVGLPEWCRSTAGFNPRSAITIEELRVLHRTGQTEEALLQQLATRPLSGVIGIGLRSGLHSTLAAGVSGSTFADLHKEGLPDSVLDALQANYLAVFVDHLARRTGGAGLGP